MNLNIKNFLFIFIFFNIYTNSIIYAQDNNSLIINKLESLERDIRDVQRKVYQSEDNKNESQPTANNNNFKESNESTASKSIAIHELRLMEIEEKFRKTNGLIEELNFKIKNLSEENIALKTNIENLLNEVNKNINSLNNVAINQEITKSDSTITNSNDDSTVEVLARINPDGSDEIIENDISTKDITNMPNNNINNTNQQIAINPKTPEDVYQRAYNMLSKGEYEAAEAAFTQFIQDYPENKLSSNAYYWLGETFYVRKNYQLSAYNFAAGYKKFPKGAKAADQLLKLGISLSSLNKPSEACATLKKLSKEFLELPARISNRADSFKERLECK